MNDELEFVREVQSRITAQGNESDLVSSADKFLKAGLKIYIQFLVVWAPDYSNPTRHSGPPRNHF
jgi:hypothetical protein